MYDNPGGAFVACTKSHLERIDDINYRPSLRRLAKILGEDHRHLSRVVREGGPRNAVLRRWLEAWTYQGFPAIELRVRATGWAAGVSPEAELWAEVLGAQRRPLRQTLNRGLPLWKLEVDGEEPLLQAVERSLIVNVHSLDLRSDWSLINLRADPWRRLREAAGLDASVVAERLRVAPELIEELEAGASVLDHDARSALLDLYTPAEGQRATLRTTYITWDVRYRRGEYTYWATDNVSQSQHEVRNDRIKRLLRLALSMEDTGDIEEVLEAEGTRFPPPSSEGLARP